MPDHRDDTATLLFLDEHLTKAIFKYKKVWRKSQGKYSFVNAQGCVKNTVNLRGEFCPIFLFHLTTYSDEQLIRPVPFVHVNSYGEMCPVTHAHVKNAQVVNPGFHMVVTVVKIESRSFSSAEIQHFRTENTRSDYY
jgi:hypothetical protein